MTKTKYLFVYGSLVSQHEVTHTLGHPVEQIYPVELKGWIRDWSIVINNSIGQRRFSSINTKAMPSYVAALNIRLPEHGEEATNPNGVVFEISEDDLNKMSARETHYKLVNVTKDLVGAPAGTVYAFAGREQFLLTPQTKATVVLPSSYVELVLEAFSALGDNMREQYLLTTSPCELSIFDSVLR